MSSDYSVFNREQAEDESDSASLDDTDQRLLTFSDSKSDVVMGHALWRQQFSTVAWLHMLNMRRERKAFVYTWVCRDKNDMKARCVMRSTTRYWDTIFPLIERAFTLKQSCIRTNNGT